MGGEYGHAMSTMTRREWLATVPMAAAAASDDLLVLENPHLRYEVRIGGGAVVSRRLENKAGKTAAAPPAEEFVLEFAGGPVMRASEFRCARSGVSELLFTHGSGLEVRVRYSLDAGRTYLRKQIALRGGEARQLLRADLENWSGVQRPWRSMTADRQPNGSHPIYCESLWAGVEFVAAFNEYRDDGFVLRSRPGGVKIGADWYSLHSTVIGVAEPGGVREAFLRYIEDIRLAPPKWSACYNSWWTLPLRPQHAELIALAAQLKGDLYGQHGVFFDLFAVDEGWTDPKSIWEIDRNALPNGFEDLRRVVESASGRMGLWISPSANYPRSTSYDWARENGFVTVPADKPRGVSLADPRYRGAMLDALRRLVTGSGFAHVKFDGFTARESVAHHDLLPDADSVEPLAAYALELMRAAKAANPALVSEPTCMNSLVNYISPWIIQHADTVWGNSGGDCPAGLGPAPDYREAATSAREYYIFSSLDEVWLPQNALQYFDIVHCDAPGGFVNHAAMAIGRGRFFLPVYLNPKFMEKEDWRIFAGLLRWARANKDVLRETRVLRSRVEVGEPYCYAHWLDGRGILAVRNPSNENREYTLELPGPGMVAYTQFPYRRAVASDAARVTLELAPWELVFIEVVERAKLREPVALGARWFAAPDGAMRVVPDRGVKEVRVLEPGGGERKFAVETRRGVLPAGNAVPLVKRGAGFELECAVTVPAEAGGTVLLLVEFPGRKHFKSECGATVNGKTATLEARHSTGHISLMHRAEGTYWKGVIPYESQWTWYLCTVGPGESKVHFRGSAAAPEYRIGAWLWAENECSRDEQAIGARAGAPEMPQYRDRLERWGLCLRRPA